MTEQSLSGKRINYLGKRRLVRCKCNTPKYPARFIAEDRNAYNCNAEHFDSGPANAQCPICDIFYFFLERKN